MAKTLFELTFEQRKYRLELVEIQGSSPFWAICGSKKGSYYCGGGIPISNLHSLYNICHLIDKISSLNMRGRTEARVDCFSNRNRVFCGETRVFNGQFYYRIKVYSNYFSKDGDIHYYRQHNLKQVGKGYYIQEFDFPISTSGIQEAKEFSSKIKVAIENHLVGMIGPVEGDPLDLLRNDKIIVGGGLPWINTDMNMENVILLEPLFDYICEKLREEPMTSNRLAIELGLTPEVGEYQLNPASRYDPRYFLNGLLLDRINKGFDSQHFIITQIPNEALQESPALTNLFMDKPPSKWSQWISATFSNDEYSKGRWQSYHIAEFEIEAFEGGLQWGVTPELPELRASAIRLFDLKRHFQHDRSILNNIDFLIQRFIAITKEVGYV